jgi:predicted transcriptional regulator
MKAIDWQQFLQQQKEAYGKVLFTATELANVSGQERASLDVTLQRLVKRGIIQRYADGRYGLPGAVSIEILTSSLDNASYITGFYALRHHNIVTQFPQEITCFTNRRHNRSRVRRTPLGKIVFVCISSKIYYKPAGNIAPPEQALCDFVYLCRRRSVVATDIVSFRNLSQLNRDKLSVCLQKYPKKVESEVLRLIGR